MRALTSLWSGLATQQVEATAAILMVAAVSVLASMAAVAAIWA